MTHQDQDPSPALPSSASTVLKSEGRRIYAFHDGTAQRFADPLLVQDRLDDALEEVDAEGFQEQLDSPIRKASADAHQKFLAAIRHAFEVQELDTRTGVGLTAQETFDLATDYFAWRDATPAAAPSAEEAPATDPEVEAVIQEVRL